LFVRAVLLVAIVGLGAAVFTVATGGLGRVVAAIGTSVDGFLDGLSATPTPRATAAIIADAPMIERPAEPYTNTPSVDLVVTLPAEVVGDPSTRLRLYLALPDQVPAPISEVSVGSTRRLVIPDVELTEGGNDFSATLVGPAGESEHSPLVTYVLDVAEPKIGSISPKNGATVNGATVSIKGKTQGRSMLSARNEANNASVTGTAASDGSFTIVLPIEPGPNGITITATDPAGNVGSIVLSYKRGTGALKAVLTASAYSISVKKLPVTLELAAFVTDPDGKPVANARVTFIITVPGIQPVTVERRTGADGRTTYRTRIPKGATTGQGQLSILVRAGALGETTDRTVITLVK
jgi:hypothetical protein